jgi:hypothetical protein
MRVRCESISDQGSESLSKVEPGGHESQINLAPCQDLTRLRAFEIYLERGGDHGHDLDDWLQAKVKVQGHTYHSG